MRIDRFLHCIRLAKSRGIAQAMIAESRVRVDGRRIEKPSDTVRVGSVLTLWLGDKARIIRIAALPIRRGPAAEARACYDELGVDVAVDEGSAAT